MARRQKGFASGCPIFAKGTFRGNRIYTTSTAAVMLSPRDKEIEFCESRHNTDRHHCRVLPGGGHFPTKITRCSKEVLVDRSGAEVGKRRVKVHSATKSVFNTCILKTKRGGLISYTHGACLRVSPYTPSCCCCFFFRLFGRFRPFSNTF